MQYNEDTPRSKMTVSDVELNAIAPFAEGHVLSANEANVLNQTLKENLRNNFAATLKKLVEAGKTEEEIQAEFEVYMAGYEFGVRKSGSGEVRSSDPVTVAARKIARDKITAALKLKGIAKKSVPAEKFAELVETLLEKDPAIREAAQAQVDAARAVGAASLDLEGLGI